MNETGVLKFHCEHIPETLACFPGFEELNRCRRQLRESGWIGVDANGIGYGNLSVRSGAGAEFYITGSSTGHLPELTPANCARVTWHDFATNRLRCEGAVASSESLTHAAVYEADPTAAAVIHCHAADLWRRLLQVVPTTSPAVEYGTAEMAGEVFRLWATTAVAETKLFAMGGHHGGIVAFGRTMREALSVLMR